MADPFAQLGISRRPANRIFGTPEITERSAPLWSNAALQNAADEKIAQQEALAVKDEQDALARERAAESEVDQLQQLEEPTARQKFLEDRGTKMAGSKRYGDVMRQQQQFEPSYADKVLQNHVALGIKHPEDLKVFNETVASGQGTLEGRRRADENALNRDFEAQLTAAGIHPTEAHRIRVEEGNSEAVRNHHIYKAKDETGLLRNDKEGQAMAQQLKLYDAQAAFELKKDGVVSPETEAAQAAVRSRLISKYDQLHSPKPAAPATPRVGTGTVLRPPEISAPEDKRTVFEKMNGVKPSQAAPPGITTPEGHPLNTAEEIKAAQQKAIQGIIKNPASSGDALARVISSPNTSLEEKTLALEKLRAQAENPSLPLGTTLGEAIERKQKNRKLLADAEKDVALHPVREEFRQAWQSEKDALDQAITEFAKSNGVPKEQVINSLVKDAKSKEPELITTVGPEGQVQQDTVQELLGQYIAQKEGKPATHDTFGQHARALIPFADHPAARELGVDGFLGTTMNRMLGLKNAGIPTRKDILEKYVEEAQASLPQTEAAPLPRVGSIEEAAKLPPGTRFLDPDGVTRTVPLKKS